MENPLTTIETFWNNYFQLDVDEKSSPAGFPNLTVVLFEKFSEKEPKSKISNRHGPRRVCHEIQIVHQMCINDYMVSIQPKFDFLFVYQGIISSLASRVSSVTIDFS